MFSLEAKRKKHETLHLYSASERTSVGLFRPFLLFSLSASTSPCLNLTFSASIPIYLSPFSSSLPLYLSFNSFFAISHVPSVSLSLPISQSHSYLSYLSSTFNITFFLFIYFLFPSYSLHSQVLFHFKSSLIFSIVSVSLSFTFLSSSLLFLFLYLPILQPYPLPSSLHLAYLIHQLPVSQPLPLSLFMLLSPTLTTSTSST